MAAGHSTRMSSALIWHVHLVQRLHEVRFTLYDHDEQKDKMAACHGIGDVYVCMYKAFEMARFLYYALTQMLA